MVRIAALAAAVNCIALDSTLYGFDAEVMNCTYGGTGTAKGPNAVVQAVELVE